MSDGARVGRPPADGKADVSASRASAMALVARSATLSAPESAGCGQQDHDSDHRPRAEGVKADDEVEDGEGQETALGRRAGAAHRAQDLRVDALEVQRTEREDEDEQRDGGDGRDVTAASLWAERGARLTRMHRRVLALLWENWQPLGAHDPMDGYRRDTGRRVGPPTVYRALDFLVRQGLATRIESRNTFVPCAHPERPRRCLFLLCGECGHSAELESAEVERLLAAKAARLGCRVSRMVIEVEGACRRCEAGSGYRRPVPRYSARTRMESQC